LGAVAARRAVQGAQTEAIEKLLNRRYSIRIKGGNPSNGAANGAFTIHFHVVDERTMARREQSKCAWGQRCE
jgi:hypothetical protein